MLSASSPRLSMSPIFTGSDPPLAYSCATDLGALMPASADSRCVPGLWYATCTHCLEAQRIERSFSWLRREWVLAHRTECSLHDVRLLAMLAGAAMHPIWTDFDRRHTATARSVCA